MRLIMTHGYMLSDTGSNVYVQNLCRGEIARRNSVEYLGWVTLADRLVELAG